eukprot:1016475-Pyramimonas_sp.AAC.2
MSQIVEMLRDSLCPPLRPREPQLLRILEDPGCVALEVLQQLLPLEAARTVGLSSAEPPSVGSSSAEPR